MAAVATNHCDTHGSSCCAYACDRASASLSLPLCACVAASCVHRVCALDSGDNFASALHDELCKEGSCDGDRWQQYTPAQKDAVLAGRRKAVAMAEGQPYAHHALGEALLFSNHAQSGGLEEAVIS